MESVRARELLGLIPAISRHLSCFAQVSIMLEAFVRSRKDPLGMFGCPALCKSLDIYRGLDGRFL